MRRGVLLLLTVFLFSFPESVQPKGKKPPPSQQGAGKSPPTVAPAPTISVSFGRQSLREGDSVPVDVWISNTSDQPLRNVHLQISAPKFTHWHEKACDQPVSKDNSFTETEISPHTTLPHPLCVSTDTEIEVGDFNIVFSLKYDWIDNGITRQSIVTNEKTIKANLFGSESVAGVPLALAGFIVPGLFFWIFVRLWRVPWNQEASKELIYSVLISVVVIGLGYYLQSKFPETRWLRYLDIRSGISGKKLFALAGAGIVLGNIVGLIYLVWTRIKRARIISPSDLLITKVLKIVNQNPKSINPKTTVRLKSAANPYVGSLVGTSAGTVWLIGWFKLDIRPYAKNKNFVNKIKRSIDDNDLAAVLRRARRKKIQLEENSQITVQDEPKGLLLSWKEDELSGQPQKVEDAGVKTLIELVE